MSPMIGWHLLHVERIPGHSSSRKTVVRSRAVHCGTWLPFFLDHYFWLLHTSSHWWRSRWSTLPPPQESQYTRPSEVPSLNHIWLRPSVFFSLRKNVEISSVVDQIVYMWSIISRLLRRPFSTAFVRSLFSETLELLASLGRTFFLGTRPTWTEIWCLCPVIARSIHRNHPKIGVSLSIRA